jgi:hypothetical protein
MRGRNTLLSAEAEVWDAAGVYLSGPPGEPPEPAVAVASVGGEVRGYRGRRDFRGPLARILRCTGYRVPVPSGTDCRWSGLHVGYDRYPSARTGTVQHGSTATHTDKGGRAWTQEDGDLHGWTWVDVLPPDGMQEVRSSNLLSSTQIRSIIRTDRTVSTAVKYSNGGPVGRRTCVRISIAPLARAAGKTRISVTARLLSGVPPGRTLVPRDL